MNRQIGYKIMKEMTELLELFEIRNNISTELILYSDTSGQLKEFWEEEVLLDFGSEEELRTFLKETNYQLDENGRCHSPVIIK